MNSMLNNGERGKLLNMTQLKSIILCPNRSTLFPKERAKSHFGLFDFPGDNPQVLRSFIYFPQKLIETRFGTLKKVKLLENEIALPNMSEKSYQTSKVLLIIYIKLSSKKRNSGWTWQEVSWVSHWHHLFSEWMNSTWGVEGIPRYGQK